MDLDVLVAGLKLRIGNFGASGVEPLIVIFLAEEYQCSVEN